MKIENATHDDVLDLVGLAQVMFNESTHYNQFDDFDPDKVFSVVSQLIDSPDGIVIVCRDENGKAVGGFVGSIGEVWFLKSTRVMCDNALFIHPAYRGGLTAPRLIEEAFVQAKEKGAAEAQITNTSGVYSEQVEKLYQFVGMTRIGGYYYKML